MNYFSHVDVCYLVFAAHIRQRRRFSSLLLGLEAFFFSWAWQDGRRRCNCLSSLIRKRRQQLQDRETQLCVIIFPKELQGFFCRCSFLFVRALFLPLLRQTRWKFFDSKFPTFPLANSAALHWGRYESLRKHRIQTFYCSRGHFPSSLGRFKIQSELDKKRWRLTGLLHRPQWIWDNELESCGAKTYGQNKTIHGFCTQNGREIVC